jgi:carbon monoxide dehydrogenase subunit G
LEQAGDYRIDAPREVVWRALNDPAVLAECIDGCQSFEPRGESRYVAVIKAKVGPVSAVFHADLEILEPDPPISYSIVGQVKAGAAGFGRGSAHITLLEDGPTATKLSYKVDGSIGGKLAQVGQRLIDAAGRKMADDFFAALVRHLAPGEYPAPFQAAARTDNRWLTWSVAGVAVAAGVVAICLWFLRR